MLRGAAHRLYADLLLPDRTDEYRQLLQRALDAGYACRTVGEHRRRRMQGDRGRAVVLRHDVDTDPATAEAMHGIERRLDVRGSFFFRLRTADVEVMRRIHRTGGEVGYHFEELASFVKAHGLRGKAEAEAELPRIRELFAANLSGLRERTGLPLTAVASHGDWMNRRLGLKNKRLLTPELREALGVEYEAYDAEGRRGAVSEFSDDAYPRYWRPSHPAAAIDRGQEVILLLTHPRHWRRAVRATAAENLVRVREGARHRRVRPS